MDGGGGRRFSTDTPDSDRKSVDVDVNVNVTAKQVPDQKNRELLLLVPELSKANEVVIDGLVVKSRFYPIGMSVLVVPQPEDRLARCQHNNFAGECLVCYRMNKGEHP